MKLSVIIGTKDRPESLKRTLETLFRQTRLPEEIILIDDGELPPTEYVSSVEAHGIRCQFLKKDRPGLVHSRNLGARVATGDVLLFLDDDVDLEPGYVKGLLQVYEQDPRSNVAGVGGVLDSVRISPFQKLFLCLFCLDSYRQGKILASGCCSLVTRIRKVERVEWLSGCNMSFRKQLFGEFWFDEAFTGNGWGDDRDFSYRIGRKYLLLATPAARLVHREDLNGRLAPFEFGQLEIHHLNYFFRKNMPKRLVNRFAFQWSCFGICLKNLLSGQHRRFQGNVAALFSGNGT